MSNGTRLVFEDDFDRPGLDTARWCPFYLPHWSDLDRTRPSYDIRDGVLRLYIAEDQRPWCPEFDGPVKVSGLQTGHFAGKIGSPAGQHRFRDGLVVRTAVPSVRSFVPHFCRLEMRARARLGPDNLASLWLIGVEDEPARCGEITVMEVFGHNAHDDRTVLGRGIKGLHDPALVDELEETALPIRIEDWHTYAIDWTAEGVRFLVDDVEVSSSRRSPDYPMQLMLNFYDLTGNSPAGRETAWFDIDVVRAWKTDLS